MTSGGGVGGGSTGPLFTYDAPNLGAEGVGTAVAGSASGILDCTSGCLIQLGDEVQTLTLASVSGAFSGGSFALTLGVHTTATCIPVTAGFHSGVDSRTLSHPGSRA
jgi:hypothetical protein